MTPKTEPPEKPDTDAKDAGKDAEKQEPIIAADGHVVLSREDIDARDQ